MPGPLLGFLVPRSAVHHKHLIQVVKEKLLVALVYLCSSSFESRLSVLLYFIPSLSAFFRPGCAIQFQRNSASDLMVLNKAVDFSCDELLVAMHTAKVHQDSLMCVCDVKSKNCKYFLFIPQIETIEERKDV